MMLKTESLKYLLLIAGCALIASGATFGQFRPYGNPAMVWTDRKTH